MLVIKSNRTSIHIDGLTIRTEGAGDEKGGVVSYYAENACGALTRSGRNMLTGTSFESPAEALKAADSNARAYGRKVCKTCRAAAMAEIIAEAHEENDARDAAAAAETTEETTVEPVLSIATDKLVPALVDTAVDQYKTWAEEYKAYKEAGTERATRALTRASATLEGSIAVLQTMWSLFEVDYSTETVRAIIRQQYETKYNIIN